MINFSAGYSETKIQYGRITELHETDIWNQSRRRILIIDPKVNRYHQNFINKFGTYVPMLILRSGENHKTFTMLDRILSFFYKHGVEKNDLIVISGGGLTLDIGGLAASIWKRGTGFAFVPTTLMAQIDACYGGKTGVNYGNTKNIIGTYSFPEEIIIDHSFLNTLPREHILSGWAEIIKVAFISDKDFFEGLESVPDLYLIDLLNQNFFLRKAIESKKRIVDDDPFEKGNRKLLNFGHTIGHALEGAKIQLGKPILHGFAIGFGMAVESLWAVKNYNFDINTHKRLINILLQSKILDFEQNINFQELIPHLLQDKKNQDGMINLSIPLTLGEGRVNVQTTLDSLADAWNSFKKEDY